MLELKIRGAAVEALETLQRQSDDLSKPLDTVGNALKNRVLQQFRQSRTPYGEQWKPSNNRTGQPLRDTGRLNRSITYNSDDSTVEIGTNVEYAPTHQFGDPKRRIRKRQILPTADQGMPPSWENAILDAFVSHFEPDQ